MWVELGAVLISSRLPKGLPFIGRLIIIFCVARRCREQALLSSLRLCRGLERIGSRGGLDLALGIQHNPGPRAHRDACKLESKVGTLIAFRRLRSRNGSARNSMPAVIWAC